ncbi:MAG: quinone-interacting membrane-bound oxidoreductase complex subunit QmoC [Polyangiaceae bacterium]|nr:quinone-interacting membrane-bound oxidoreductase complex subunit QmoC [Polyangiaceae bacterium]
MVKRSPHRDSAPAKKPRPKRVVPDREVVRRLLGSGGDAMGQCMQCATCSAVCELTPDDAPFPRKEMLWAQWGLVDRLVSDVDIWLCHECHDCTVRCPRGARPGDVMAALRQACVSHYSFPQGLARAAAAPAGLVWIVLASAALLAAASIGWDATGVTVAELTGGGTRIAIPFWTRFPHGLLIALFLTVFAFDVAVLGLGMRRYWRALSATALSAPTRATPNAWGQSLRAALGRIVWHDDFASCQHEARRRFGHGLVVYGTVGLMVVDLWVVTARQNPLLSGLVYPLGLADPWKLLANLAGVALVMGCVMMGIERLRRRERWFPGGKWSGLEGVRRAPSGTYGDWLLLGLISTVVLTGFVTEGLHLFRVDELRYAAYAAHLVSVTTLFVVLPYSKLAHLAYRTLAFLFVERYGLRRRAAVRAETAPAASCAQPKLSPQEVP